MPVPWSGYQIVLDDTESSPLRPGSHALTNTPASPTKNQSPGLHTADAHLQGGAAAERVSAKAAKRADWPRVASRVHSVGTCAECEAKWPARCASHCAPAGKDQPICWWHAPVGDPAIDGLVSDAERRERESLKEPDSGWRVEWRRVRAEQLRLQGQERCAAPERMRAGRPESVEWIHVGAFEPQIGYLCREEGWEREQAVGYTLLSCGGAGALARAARDGSHDYSASRAFIGRTLLERVAKGARAAPAPPVYLNLTGPLGLATNDEAWRCLHPDAELGITFVSSTLVVATAAPETFQTSRGACSYVARSGVREWMPGESDVVCFLSEPSDASAATDAAGASGVRVARLHRSMVHMGGMGYHLPPGATIVLVSIQDKFRGAGNLIKRRLFTVRFGFDIDDPAILRGDASSATVLPPSFQAVADACQCAAASAAGGTSGGGNGAHAPADGGGSGGGGGGGGGGAADSGAHRPLRLTAQMALMAANFAGMAARRQRQQQERHQRHQREQQQQQQLLLLQLQASATPGPAAATGNGSGSSSGGGGADGAGAKATSSSEAGRSRGAANSGSEAGGSSNDAAATGGSRSEGGGSSVPTVTPTSTDDEEDTNGGRPKRLRGSSIDLPSSTDHKRSRQPLPQRSSRPPTASVALPPDTCSVNPGLSAATTAATATRAASEPPPPPPTPPQCAAAAACSPLSPVFGALQVPLPAGFVQRDSSGEAAAPTAAPKCTRPAATAASAAAAAPPSKRAGKERAGKERTGKERASAAVPRVRLSFRSPPQPSETATGPCDEAASDAAAALAAQISVRMAVVPMAVVPPPHAAAIVPRMLAVVPAPPPPIVSPVVPPPACSSHSAAEVARVSLPGAEAVRVTCQLDAAQPDSVQLETEAFAPLEVGDSTVAPQGAPRRALSSLLARLVSTIAEPPPWLEELPRSVRALQSSAAAEAPSPSDDTSPRKRVTAPQTSRRSKRPLDTGAVDDVDDAVDDAVDDDDADAAANAGTPATPATPAIHDAAAAAPPWGAVGARIAADEFALAGRASPAQFPRHKGAAPKGQGGVRQVWCHLSGQWAGASGEDSEAVEEGPPPPKLAATPPEDVALKPPALPPPALPPPALPPPATLPGTGTGTGAMASAAFRFSSSPSISPGSPTLTGAATEAPSSPSSATLVAPSSSAGGGSSAGCSCEDSEGGEGCSDVVAFALGAVDDEEDDDDAVLLVLTVDDEDEPRSLPMQPPRSWSAGVAGATNVRGEDEPRSLPVQPPRSWAAGVAGATNERGVVPGVLRSAMATMVDEDEDDEVLLPDALVPLPLAEEAAAHELPSAPPAPATALVLALAPAPAPAFDAFVPRRLSSLYDELEQEVDEIYEMYDELEHEVDDEIHHGVTDELHLLRSSLYDEVAPEPEPDDVPTTTLGPMRVAPADPTAQHGADSSAPPAVPSGAPRWAFPRTLSKSRANDGFVCNCKVCGGRKMSKKIRCSNPCPGAPTAELHVGEAMPLEASRADSAISSLSSAESVGGAPGAPVPLVVSPALMVSGLEVAAGLEVDSTPLDGTALEPASPLDGAMSRLIDAAMERLIDATSTLRLTHPDAIEDGHDGMHAGGMRAGGSFAEAGARHSPLSDEPLGAPARLGADLSARFGAEAVDHGSGGLADDPSVGRWDVRAAECSFGMRGGSPFDEADEAQEASMGASSPQYARELVSPQYASSQYAPPTVEYALPLTLDFDLHGAPAVEEASEQEEEDEEGEGGEEGAQSADALFAAFCSLEAASRLRERRYDDPESVGALSLHGSLHGSPHAVRPRQTRRTTLQLERRDVTLAWAY